LSYPFVKAVNWDEFITQMRGLGVSFKAEDIPSGAGQKVHVTYFEHTMDGKTFTCVVDIVDREQMLLPSMIRGICKSLHIHPVCFGLDLV
jgi:hypothetical protein